MELKIMCLELNELGTYNVTGEICYAVMQMRIIVTDQV